MTLSVYLGVVSRHQKSFKTDFPVTLMVYHRKNSTFIKKCCGILGIYQRLDLSEKHIQKYYFKFCVNC